MCRPVSVSVKILQSTAICQVSGLWSWPYFSCNKYHLCFIVITTVSITASGSCCGRWKGGHPYGTAYHIKGVLCLGRFLQTSMVGHLRPNSIPTKSVGILAFISRSRNKTLIPGNSVCIIHSVTDVHTILWKMQGHMLLSPALLQQWDGRQSGPADRQAWATVSGHQFHFFHPLWKKRNFGEVDVIHST